MSVKSKFLSVTASLLLLTILMLPANAASVEAPNARSAPPAGRLH